MNRRLKLGFGFLACVALNSACTEATTSPSAPRTIDRLQIFVRDWPSDYVEIDFRRSAGANTLVMFRPPQPGVPRILLDSIGPNANEPAEIVDLLKTFNVWALADSNAVGGACSTKSGQWFCNATSNDYSLVMAVTSGGTVRSQRYTRLKEASSSKTARALGDFIFEWSRKAPRGN